MIFQEEDYLAHYGILRKSGRYPWGSGKTPNERNRTFLDTVESMRKSGMSEAEIARSFSTKENPFTTSDLRALKSIALNQQKRDNIATAQKLAATGMSNVAIGKEMGINESSVRNLLAPGVAERADILKSTADMLKRQVGEKDYIDIGTSVENQLGISQTKLKTAVAMLKEEGYKVHYLKVPQVGTGEMTTYKILSKPDVPWSEVNNAAKQGNIRQIQEWSDDGGRSFTTIQPPLHIDSKRVGINYKEDGGDQADGVIYVRPGVPDVSLGKARYAQVRIAVDGTHYLKGMAMYKDDLPEGHDLVFNTNKSRSADKHDAMKPLKTDKDGNVDPADPFGAQISRQIPKFDIHGNEIKNSVSSVMNIVNEEGKWDEWSRTLSTQFLSKQSPTLAREQLDMTYERKKNELAQIKALTNPAIKRRLLESYADDADSSAVKMKAQALPRQRTQVILPVKSLKDNEVYAPNFKNGERVVLIRHPHGGTFEIPELVVNNNNREAQRSIGTKEERAKDAIGINHKVASRLSGADFDGDTVLVIPNNAGRVKTDRALEGLKNFDPQSSYKPYDGMKTIDGGTYHAATKSVDYGGRAPKGQTKQTEMGKISNLITDMTIKRASTAELAAAVRHSMVVIDAEKHHLDYKKSAADNGIPALVKKYQARDDGRSGGGASTLISRAKREVVVPQRKGRPASEGGPIDKATGKRVFVPTGESFVSKKTGQTVVRTEKVKQLLELDSAHQLSSGTLIEKIYADHSDRLRALANEARKEYVNIKSTPYSPSAKQAYAPQVASLNAKLNRALQNSPRERQAQLVANARINAIKAANPGMDAADLKKVKSKALIDARARTGADKERVEITADEWKAIQAGAISNHNLERILAHANLDQVKELATPRVNPVMTKVMESRAKSMLNSGYTQADVAAQLGIPLSTLKSSIARGGS